MIRVLWVLPHFEYGARLFFPTCMDLAQFLRPHDVQVIIAAPRAFNEPLRETICGVDVYRSADVALPMADFRYPLPVRLGQVLRTVVKDRAIDVVNWHGYHYLTALWIPYAKKVLRLPTVLTTIGFPGLTWRHPRPLVNAIASVYARTVGMAALGMVDHLVVDFPSNAVGVKGIDFSASRVHWIPWGIDTTLFRPRPELRAAVRFRLGFKEDDCVVVYCGRLASVKGVGVLVDAVHELVPAHPNIKLLIIGGGGPGFGGDSEQRHAEKLLGDRLVVTGVVAHQTVPEYLQAGDVAVQPSFAESGGGFAMEAAACGLSVIASRTGGLQDVVVDGKTGLLVQPGSAAQLARSIALFAENRELRRSCGEAGRNHIVEHFRWEATAERYALLYNEVLGNRVHQHFSHGKEQ
ncbi:MAG: glycosyltransferase family 4 protein [Dehalococcoidia bacterium]|nr:glycosyltransferase family 4 protein [Dehalococcoidia bacterium]